MLTKVGPVQSLVRQPHLKPSSFLVLVKGRHCETCAIDCNRVALMTIGEDGRRIRYDYSATSIVALDGGYSP